MLAIVAEVVIRWAGTVVRSSSWFAVWGNWSLVWSGDWLAVGSGVVWASEFAVAWASEGAVRGSIELTVGVVNGRLSWVSEWELSWVSEWKLWQDVMGNWELTVGEVRSWLAVMDDFLGVEVEWLAIRSSQWLAVRSVVETGQWLANFAKRGLANSAKWGLATVGNSSKRSLGDSIARLGVTNFLVTVSVGCLSTEATESRVALAVAGAELATVAVTEVAICSWFGTNSTEASNLSASVETEVTGTSNSAKSSNSAESFTESKAAEVADTVSVAEAASVSVAEVVSTTKSFAQ